MLSRIRKFSEQFYEMAPTPVELLFLAREVAKDFKAEANRCQIQIEIDPFGDANATVYVDARIMKENIRRIMENAMRELRHPEVKTKLLKVCVRGGHTCASISIYDTGRGFSNEQLNRIKHRRAISKGLGILLTASLCDAMRGKFDVESSRDAGTTITMTFPYEETHSHGPGQSKTACR